MLGEWCSDESLKGDLPLWRDDLRTDVVMIGPSGEDLRALCNRLLLIPAFWVRSQSCIIHKHHASHLHHASSIALRSLGCHFENFVHMAPCLFQNACMTFDHNPAATAM
jgi:hypothetical protein